MTDRVRQLSLLIAAALGAFLLGFLLLRTQSPPTGPTPDAPPDDGSRRTRVPAPAAHAARRPAAPAAETPAPTSQTPAPDAPAPGAQGDPGGERAAAPAEARSDESATRIAIGSQMGEVRDAISPCVARWTADDPTIAGSLTLSFSIDADGLVDVWIMDHSEVPDPLLQCFSDAIYGVDWSAITRDPVDVTWPFSFHGGDRANP